MKSNTSTAIPPVSQAISGKATTTNSENSRAAALVDKTFGEILESIEPRVITDPERLAWEIFWDSSRNLCGTDSKGHYPPLEELMLVGDIDGTPRAVAEAWAAQRQ